MVILRVKTDLDTSTLENRAECEKSRTTMPLINNSTHLWRTAQLQLCIELTTHDFLQDRSQYVLMVREYSRECEQVTRLERRSKKNRSVRSSTADEPAAINAWPLGLPAHNPCYFSAMSRFSSIEEQSEGNRFYTGTHHAPDRNPWERYCCTLVLDLGMRPSTKIAGGYE